MIIGRSGVFSFDLSFFSEFFSLPSPLTFSESVVVPGYASKKFTLGFSQELQD
jgi:hypothetical protein